MASAPVTIGGYKIEREIGRGNFGIVYRALHQETGQIRAVKVLSPAAAKDPELRHRLRREAKLASHLASPHVVHIYEFDETSDGHAYIAMELLEGRELTLALREAKRFSVERVAHVGRQILSALAESHAAGIIHRDLKPSNIFLCSTANDPDFVKVFDFGIAKVGQGGSLQETARLTMAGGVLGTPTYMSPEQCTGQPLTIASDIYATGILLYELAAGYPPFYDENQVRVLMMQSSDPPPPLPADIAGTPVGKAILRALEKSPADRFATAAEFAEALGGGGVSVAPKPVPSAALGNSAAPTTGVAPSGAIDQRVAPVAAPSPSAPSTQAAPQGKSGCAGMVLAAITLAAAGGTLAWAVIALGI